MSEITEWEFTADVASQINGILAERPDLPFSEARCEQRETGVNKRRDITLLNRANKPVFTGEVKMPDKRDGRSPLNEAVVLDAHNKANAIGVEYFFTWNVNDCVLWKTFEQGKPITERHLEFLKAFPSPILNSDDLLTSRVQDQVGDFLERLLDRCAAILSGERPLAKLPIDEKFTRVWELALMPIVGETLSAINFKFNSDTVFKRSLEKWMRDEQELTLSTDEAVIRENLERSAKFSSYVLANKIVFYEALRKQFPDLRKLEIGDEITTGDEMAAAFSVAFAHATEVTKDYETVFVSDFGDSLPLLNKNSVDSWKDLLSDTSKFDFTEIPYEVLGHIFENLLSPEERHKFGQHYTRSEIVDLINVFCIRRADAKVMDPSCGGGTFLVRAYQRKKDLSAGKLGHQRLIEQIYGTDISAYPVHLTTMNLATRDLKEGANYPLVARKDFLKTKLNSKIFNVPDENGENLRPLPKMDAIVGNPPYIRQEKITEYYGKNYKKLLQATVHHDAPGTELSGRSDILCYFFTHSFTLLADDGYIGLLTSSNWLDTSYGFDLQKFLLENFEIIAIFESNCEPWFTGARVTTAATILRKQPDAEKRNANNVKFAWLKKPIADFVAISKGDEDARRTTFEGIRDRIEGLTAEEENDTWRVRVVNQADLYRAGCLSFDILPEDEIDEENTDEDDPNAKTSAITAVQTNLIGDVEQPSLRIASAEKNTSSQSVHSEYKGSKWGIFLRAPEIFNKLVRIGGSRFVPLGQIADIKRGITSGCDAFFFPRDLTAEKLAEKLTDAQFKDRYGITKQETTKIRIVHAGDGSQHLIETDYLEPVVFNSMELDSLRIDESKLKRKILVLGLPKEKLKDKKVFRYLRYGEQQGFHLRSTTLNRNIWYEMPMPKRGDVLWLMTQRYRFFAPVNRREFICNKRLFNITASEADSANALSAVLNSTIVALFRFSFGRMQGGDPVSETEVSDMKMILVPNVNQATNQSKERLVAALDSMLNRKVGHLVNVDSDDEENWTGELAFADRQDLDDAVLELVGIDDPIDRLELREEIYREITQLYRQIRSAEKVMQRFRSQTAHRGKQSPHSIADEIWEELSTKPKVFTALDYVPGDAEKEMVDLPAGKASVVTQGLLGSSDVKIGDTYISLGTPERSNFVKSLADLSVSGKINVPVSPEICQQALDKHNKQVEELNKMFLTEASTFTADENLQERVVKELWKKMTE